MKKFKVYFFDESGEEFFEEFSGEDGLVEYIEDLEYSHGALIGTVHHLQDEVAALKDLLDAYRIFSEGRNVQDN